MKPLDHIPPLVVDEIAVRDNRGRDRLHRDAHCIRCRADLRHKARYRVRTYKSATMAAPAFYYYCMECRCP
jgi:hypothetical protein